MPRNQGSFEDPDPSSVWDSVFCGMTKSFAAAAIRAVIV